MDLDLNRKGPKSNGKRSGSLRPVQKKVTDEDPNQTGKIRIFQVEIRIFMMTSGSIADVWELGLYINHLCPYKHYFGCIFLLIHAFMINYVVDKIRCQLRIIGSFFQYSTCIDLSKVEISNAIELHFLDTSCMKDLNSR